MNESSRKTSLLLSINSEDNLISSDLNCSDRSITWYNSMLLFCALFLNKTCPLSSRPDIQNSWPGHHMREVPASCQESCDPEEAQTLASGLWRACASQTTFLLTIICSDLGAMKQALSGAVLMSNSIWPRGLTEVFTTHFIVKAVLWHYTSRKLGS